jgi:hypothetical protein
MARTWWVQLLLLALFSAAVLAQTETPKYNFDIGGGPGFPVSTISDFANTGGNFVVGGGPNLGSMLGFNGEFMWHGLPPKSQIVALTGAPDGSANLYSVTGNMFVRSKERGRIGLYGIGGIGWYHRNWQLTAPTLSVGTVCLPSYVWWGVACTNGLVESTVELHGGSSDGFGWNVGGGFTFRLGESHAKIYAESRYHKAYHSHIDTEVVPLTFGLRW